MNKYYAKVVGAFEETFTSVREARKWVRTVADRVPMRRGESRRYWISQHDGDEYGPSVIESGSVRSGRLYAD